MFVCLELEEVGIEYEESFSLDLKALYTSPPLPVPSLSGGLQKMATKCRWQFPCLGIFSTHVFEVITGQ